MMLCAVSVVDPRKKGDGSQLTEEKGIETATVTAEPEVAELSGLGLTVTLAPLIDEPVK
jgi:hypothetical protein